MSLIPDDVKAEIAATKAAIERLEAEQNEVARAILERIAPFADTVDGCDELVALVPDGFCTHAILEVRRGIRARERAAEREAALNVHRCPMCGKYVIYDTRNFHPYCGCGYDQLNWNDGLNKVSRAEAEKFVADNE
jgi:endogenous inhibitor of DNA gyrase (YacG/DUF329 family)